MATLARATAASMSLRSNGSGSSRFNFGSSTSASWSELMPRPTRSRASISEIPPSRASARTAASSGSRETQRRPENDRATPKTGARVNASILILPADMARLHPAHGTRAGAHENAFSGDVLPMEMHALQHRAVCHARRRKHHIAGGELIQRVFAIEIGDAQPRGACALVVLLEHETRLHLSADTTQRRRRQHALGRTTLPQIDVD